MDTPPRRHGRAGLALVLTTIAIGVACSGGGGRLRPAGGASPPPASASVAPLEGEWRLTAMQLADGSSRRVTGFLRFDGSGTMRVHAELAGDEPAARPPRTVVADFTTKASPADGRFDFAGLSMGVGAERLTEDAVPMEEWRHYEVDGSTLRLSARDRSGRTGATLVFERVP